MFISTRRPILIPQSEHLKLVGTLALLWGNPQFELPPLPRLSVVAGIGLHDRAYGCLDNLPIGAMEDTDWLPVTRHGFFMPCADPVADLITRCHLLRLVSGKDTPARKALADEMRQAIQAQIRQTGLDAALLAQVDRMTDFCDSVSFDFCREAPAQGQVEVFSNYASAETTTLRYQVAEGEITLDPWPLNVDEYTGYLVGYAQEGYPERLESLVIPFHIRPALHN